jgi:hypothetical protein
MMDYQKVHQAARAGQAGAGVGATPMAWGGFIPPGGGSRHRRDRLANWLEETFCEVINDRLFELLRYIFLIVSMIGIFFQQRCPNHGKTLVKSQYVVLFFIPYTCQISICCAIFYPLHYMGGCIQLIPVRTYSDISGIYRRKACHWTNQEAPKSTQKTPRNY